MSVTFVNSFCMDFNVEPFLSNLSVMPACVQQAWQAFYNDVSTYVC